MHHNHANSYKNQLKFPLQVSVFIKCYIFLQTESYMNYFNTPNYIFMFGILLFPFFFSKNCSQNFEEGSLVCYMMQKICNNGKKSFVFTAH